jgi:hypothetical protein
VPGRPPRGARGTGITASPCPSRSRARSPRARSNRRGG